MEGRIINIEDGMEQATQDSRDRLDALSSNVDATKAAVLSLRGMGQNIMSFISTFPIEMRDLLQKILLSNWQVYHMLLTIQQSPAPSPTGILESNIKFEDAMGELKELPYEFFRHWEVWILQPS